MSLADLYDASHLLRWQDGPRGIVRIDDGNHFGRTAANRFQTIEIQFPSIFRAELNLPDAAAQVLGQSPDLAVAGRNDDYLVAWLQQSAANHAVRLRCPHSDQNVAGISAGIQSRNPFPQQPRAVYLRIIEGEVEKLLRFMILDQLPHVRALHRAVCEVVF